MSTQHPDNASVPFFASSQVLAGEDEIREAYYAYSHLGCDEQMWDVEGKEIDAFVVKKLLSYFEPYFRTHTLGEDVRLTLRVPNPAVETAEAKVLLETLESIPRSFDAARLFYGRDVAPIFEVILPMTTSAADVDRIFHYYADFIVGRQRLPVRPGDLTVAEWLGPTLPERIEVIPLFEDVEGMFRAADVVGEYLRDKDVCDQRVFLARSDTAMNFGLVAAALANKVALQRLARLSTDTGVRIHPILGMGSAPFRGGLRPDTAQRVGREYPSVVTFTIQSAFKYDYPPHEVQRAVEHLKSREIGEPTPVDEGRVREIIDRYSASYREQVATLAPAINRAAAFVPRRRARKLHVGLFGYARQMGGVSLPRAISFTCALYSIGTPPELLGLDALTDEDFRFVRATYPSFDAKVVEALAHADVGSPLFPETIRRALVRAGYDVEPDGDHLELVRRIREALSSGQEALVHDLVLQAAVMRRFLG